jgi:hypothetical protein
VAAAQGAARVPGKTDAAQVAARFKGQGGPDARAQGERGCAGARDAARAAGSARGPAGGRG